MASAGSADTELRISTGGEDVSRLYPWLARATAASGLSEDVLYKMHVAAEEAVMNVAKHAYPPGEAAEFSVKLEVSPEAVVLRIEDTGLPFDPLAPKLPGRPGTLSEAKPGGLGLGLMRHNCPDISYERVDGQNRLTMRYPLAPV